MGLKMGLRLSSVLKVATLTLSSFISAAAFAQNYPVEIVRGTGPNGRVTGLELKLAQPEVGDDLKVVVTGKLDRAGWSLVGNSFPVIKNGAAKREFAFKMTLTSAATPIKFLAIGPAGELMNERAFIKFPGWVAMHSPASKQAVKAKPGKRWSANGGLGISHISYTQTRIADYSMTCLTLKGGYQYALSPGKWDLGVSGYFTLMPLAGSGPTGNIRFLGINIKAGRVLTPISRSPWSLKLQGGIYYTTTLPTAGAEFGFKNMWGPEIYPVLDRALANGNHIYGYAKFSPIMDGFSFLSLSNREIAFGAGWVHPLSNGRSWSIGLDLAQFEFTVTDSHVTSNSISIGAGYGF
jgi:hypothetical protein